MKKIFKYVYSFGMVFILLFITGCVNNKKDKVSLIVPTGTPSLGIASALVDDTLIDSNIVSGSDSLIAAFTNANYDIVVAPVNLGAKFYNINKDFAYILYKTIVWGNYYLASNSEITSLDDLDGKTVVVFGKNSTPDVVMRTLMATKNINVKLEYVDDVSTANSYLITGKADIIVSAEPSLTKLSLNKSFYTLDLQNEWQKITGSYSFPQAGIFVKKNMQNEKSVLDALNKMIESVEMATNKPNVLVANAVSVDENLAKIGEEILQKAVKNCNLKIEEKEKNAIDFYFSKVLELGIGVTIGGKLPDEAFYYKK